MFRTLLSVALLSIPVVAAADPAYQNLSFPGDGTTPSLLDRIGRQPRELKTGRYGGSTNDKGDLGWSYGFELPPGRLAPSLSISYSSNGGAHSVVERGWSFSDGPRISKVTGVAQAQAWEGRDVYEVSGGGFDGQLIRDDLGNWSWLSDSPGQVVVAISDVDSHGIGTFELTRQGVVTEFQAHFPAGAESEITKWLQWHPVRQEDLHGNFVEWEWDNTLLEFVRYGGNTVLSQGHVVEVELFYGNRPFPSYDSSTGTLDVLTDRVRKVIVRTDAGSGFEERYRYDLHYDWFSGESQLASLQWHTMGNEGVSRTLATFDYSVYSDDFDEVTDGWDDLRAIPRNIGDTAWSTEDDFRTVSKRVASMFDQTGDGLPDAVVRKPLVYPANAWEWRNSRQTRDDDQTDPEPYPAFEPWAHWSDEDSGDGSAVPAGWEGDSFETTTTAVLWTPEPGESLSSSYTMSRVIDINGDGFQDLVSAPGRPAEAGFPISVQWTGILGDQYPEGQSIRINDEAYPTNWSVWYGVRGGFADEPVLVAAPYPFLRMSGNPAAWLAEWGNQLRVPWIPEDEQAPYYFVDSGGIVPAGSDAEGLSFLDAPGAMFDLMDWNGDGWQDFVQFGPVTAYDEAFGAWHGPRVWYMDPETQSFATVADEPLFGQTELIASMRSASYAVSVVTTEAIELDDAHGPIYGSPTSRWITQGTRTVQQRMDLNGDGLEDFVQSEGFYDADRGGFGESGGDWEVFFGRPGGGFEGTSVLWPAPRSYMSRTDEGLPSVLVCALYSAGGLVEPPVQEVETLIGDLGLGGELVWADNTVDASMVEVPLAGCDWSTAYPLSLTEEFPGVYNPSDARSEVIEGTLDVNGDGRPDFVDARLGLWWRNTGGAFDSQAQSVPDWYPVALSASKSIQAAGAVGSFNLETGTYGVSDVIAGFFGREVDAFSLMDLDRNALPDLVVIPTTDNPQGQVIYGQGTRPGLLTDVLSEGGLEQEIWWDRSSRMFPSGRHDTGVVQEMASQTDVVSSMSVFDRTISDSAIPDSFRTFEWSDGYCSGGVCAGFRNQLVDDWLGTVLVSERQKKSTYKPDDLLDELACAVAPGVAVKPGSLLAYQELTSVSLTPFGGPVWASNIPALRQDHCFESLPPVDGLGRWVSSWSKTIEYAEDLVSLSRVVTQEIEWGAEEMPVSMTHLASDRPEDKVEITAGYVYNDAIALVLPAWMRTKAVDPFTGTFGTVVEEGRFFYDGSPTYTSMTPSNGQLTKQEVCSATAGTSSSLCAAKLTWSFAYDARGNVGTIDGPLGEDKAITAWGFGGVVPLVQVNALGHITTTQIDALGRPIRVTDPNGAAAITEYDPFGRAVATFRQAQGGDVEQLTATTYVDDAPVRYVQTDVYGESGPVSRSYSRLNGFGDAVQSWTPDEAWVLDADPTGWLVSGHFTNALGNTTQVYPTWRESGAFDDTAPLTHAEAIEEHEFDAWGRARRSYLDLIAHPLAAPRMVDFPKPGVTVTTDELGFKRQVTADSHGRTLSVDEGTGTLEFAGSYLYDGRGRIAQFTTPEDIQYKYTWDGAGRLSKVDRKNPATSWLQWAIYAYNGKYPTAMAAGPGNQITWAYDLLGRTTSKVVRDDHATLVAGSFQTRTYTWEWDGIPSEPGYQGFIGARARTTDPSGSTTYHYDDPGLSPWGRLGRLTSTEREWTGGGPWGAADSVEPSNSYDFQGQVEQTIWPSGTVVTTNRTDAGALLGYTISPPAPGADLDLERTYNEWGQVESITAPFSHRWLFERTSPKEETRQVFEEWTHPSGWSELIAEELTWQDNGLMARKQVQPFGLDFDFEYDNRQRLYRILDHGGSATVRERYGYDGDNQLTNMRHNPIGGPNKEFTYAEDGWNRLVTRFQTGAGREAHSYGTLDRVDRIRVLNAAGVQQSERKFYYEGSGRLAAIGEGPTASPPLMARYHYDVDDQMVLEEDDLATASPKVTRRFGGWTETWDNGVLVSTTESLVPGVRTENDELRYTVSEGDGHALAVYDEALAERSREVVGAYGLPITSTSTPGPWPIDGFHGQEVDRERRVVHMGTRHMLWRDGMWLQPEPLLWLGAVGLNTADPGGFLGVYAGGRPTEFADPSGYFVEGTKEQEEEKPWMMRAGGDEGSSPASDMTSNIKPVENEQPATQGADTWTNNGITREVSGLVNGLPSWSKVQSTMNSLCGWLCSGAAGAPALQAVTPPATPIGSEHKISDDSYVVRGGITTVDQIQNGISDHRDVPGLRGFSAQAKDGASIYDLAEKGGVKGAFPHGKVSWTTAGALRALGCDVVRSPGGGANHVTVTGDVTADKISEAFNQIDNPAKK